MNEAYETLTLDEQALMDRLNSLHDKLLLHGWEKYGRGDAFFALIFDRKKKGRQILGTNATLFDSTLVFGDVTIGDHTHVGQQTTLDGTGGLVIGDFCSVASGVRIQTHDSSKWAVSGGKAKYDYAPVTIEDCCFIGANSVITPGIRIGSHSVVGAGSVVTRDIPPYTIVAGVPAYPIGKVVIEGERVNFLFNRNSHNDNQRFE